MGKPITLPVWLLAAILLLGATVAAGGAWSVTSYRCSLEAARHEKYALGSNQVINELIARGFVEAWKNDSHVMEGFCRSFPGGMDDGGHYLGFNQNPYGIQFTYKANDGFPDVSPGSRVPASGDLWEVQCGSFVGKIVLTAEESRVVRDYYFGE
ncbi:hypothetical protein [Blastopirellula marina]|uniref:Uncharacterized protein n=1 Tax=Blastopirellula marina TaxID=124 RepID=A0A2S8F6T1_9BACT|nr:hypothetical protein [Blastopirellula marina]PQO27867.1 hypothetical protein C5Y98_26430 [Blastopirellula marina]PTL41602.1 hypothetical protein C5Y97_26445 [Blastopirellula marina]